MRAEIECSELHFTTISTQFLLNCSKTYVLADWLLLMLLKYMKKIKKSRLSNWPLFPRIFPRYLGQLISLFSSFQLFVGFSRLCSHNPSLSSRRMKSIFGTINCGIIITINNNSVSGDVGFVEKLTKYRFIFLRFEIRLLHLVEKKRFVTDCTVEFEWNV